ncbi:MAG: rod shape-determining protein MreC, partial [Candidatus Sungiibacteriota bacterium]
MKKKSVIISVTLAILLSISVVVFASFSLVAALRTGSARLLRQMMRVTDGVSRTIGSGFQIFSFSSCDACDEERIARDIAEAKLTQAMDENESLKKILGLKQQFTLSLTPAAVLLYNQEWDREWLIIDAGEDKGVQRGDIVIDDQQFLVGEVVEVGPLSATVAIVSNKGTTFSIALASAGGEALAHGLGARAFGLDLIPRDTIINLGDIVARTSKS